jgi:P-type Cu+ transporter
MTLATPAPETGAAPTHGHPAEFTCAMHPEVLEPGTGDCPKCGMALEPLVVAPAAGKVEYIALEPRDVTVEDNNPELANMTQRFWISLSFTVPTLVIMAG